MDIIDLGIIEYKEALQFQAGLVQKRIDKKIPDTLIVLEHEPVVTLGRIGKENSIINKNFFDKENIPVISSGRGGEITYHAPGQLVLYPIVDLAERRRDITFYIDFLEKTITRSLNRFGIPAERIDTNRGVWVHGKKIGFIGIAVKRWVSYHGVSVNINNDVAPFAYMHPCGEKGTRVISAKQVLRRKLDMGEVRKVFAEQFIEDLGGFGSFASKITEFVKRC